MHTIGIPIEFSGAFIKTQVVKADGNKALSSSTGATTNHHYALLSCSFIGQATGNLNMNNRTVIMGQRKVLVIIAHVVLMKYKHRSRTPSFTANALSMGRQTQ